MKKNIILTILIIVMGSTLVGCNLNRPKQNSESSNKSVEKLSSSKIETISTMINDKSSNYFKINSSDRENMKLHKQAYNTCYDLYKQGVVLRNYVLDVDEMCFDHGKNTVYEIIYNCAYKDMDIEVPLESLKTKEITLKNKLNELSKNQNIKEYVRNFKAYYDKGDYGNIEKALLSDMSCDEFVLKDYNKKINSVLETQKKILDEMKKQLEDNIIK